MNHTLKENIKILDSPSDFWREEFTKPISYYWIIGRTGKEIKIFKIFVEVFAESINAFHFESSQEFVPEQYDEIVILAKNIEI